MERSAEKLHCSPSSRAMQLFVQSPRSIPLWFLAKLSRNCLGICQVYGKRCTSLQQCALFSQERFRRELEIDNRSNFLALSGRGFAPEKGVNLGRFLLSLYRHFAQPASLVASFFFRQCRPGDNNPSRVLRRLG